MDFELNEQQIAFRDVASEFRKRELEPNAARWDAERIFPVDVIRRAGDLGFLSLYTPQGCFGLGLGRLDASLIFEELSRGCTATTAYMTIHNMVCWAVATFAERSLVERVGEDLAKGTMLASYCLTEPNSGSDAVSMKTLATKEGKDFRLSGSKAFISGAGETDALLVMARTDLGHGPIAGAQGISAFFVPADTRGVSYGRDEPKMGWRSQPTRMVHFEDVQVPENHLVGATGQGFKIAMQALDGGRVNIASCSLGTAQAALETGISYLEERRQFGHALRDNQALQFRLSDVSTSLVAARQLVRLAACKLDVGADNVTLYCAMAKKFATDAAFDVCNQAMQFHGGYGYLQELPLERFVRDTRAHQILEGTNEIMNVIIARRLLVAGFADTLQ